MISDIDSVHLLTTFLNTIFIDVSECHKSNIN